MKKIFLMMAAMLVLAVTAAENGGKELLTGKWQFSKGLTGTVKEKAVTFQRSADTKSWIATMNFKVEAGATYSVQAVINGIDSSKNVNVMVRFDKSQERKHFAPALQADKSYLAKGEFTVPDGCKNASFSIWRGKGPADEKIVVSKYSVKKIK